MILSTFWAIISQTHLVWKHTVAMTSRSIFNTTAWHDARLHAWHDEIYINMQHLLSNSKPRPPRSWLNGGSNQGCQIFLCTIYQNGDNTPNEHNIHQSVLKYTKWPENWPNGHKICMPVSSIVRPSKIYPNWDFWFEKYTIWQPWIKPLTAAARSILVPKIRLNGWGARFQSELVLFELWFWRPLSLICPRADRGYNDIL
jgi:hypothetical protein